METGLRLDRSIIVPANRPGDRLATACFGFPRIALPLRCLGGGPHSLRLDGTYLDAVYAVLKVHAKQLLLLFSSQRKALLLILWGDFLSIWTENFSFFRKKRNF